MKEIGRTNQLQIGALIFPGIDQIDFTGPFEVFSRLPGATYQVIAKDKKPIRDTRGLILTPGKKLLGNNPARSASCTRRSGPGGVDGR